MDKDIEIQKVQQETDVKPANNVPGKNIRPLYAPTQTYGNNLTYCFVAAYATCNDNTLTDISGTITMITKGKYQTKQRTPTIPYGVLRIPENGEYMISYQPSLASKTYSSNPAYTYRIEDNGGKTRTKVKIGPTGTYSENEWITFVDSFTSGDELMPKILQNSGGNLSGGMKLYVIKL